MKNDDIIFKNMLNTMRDMRFNAGRRITEEYEGDYGETQSGDDMVVTDQNYPGVKEQIIAPLTQKLPLVKLEDDALKVNKEKSTITLEGRIPSLAGLQFVIATDISNTEPLHISVENLNFSEDGLSSLTALHAFAKTFFAEWSANKIKETFK
jgi:hypothetical protein